MDIGSDKIATRLYEDIVVGVFSFGSKLVEERLAERYETKRHTLREAFGALEELGFVERVPNRGVYVREPHPTEVHELYQMRALLECYATRETVLPSPMETTDEMRDIQDQHSLAIRELRLRDVLHLNTEFHRVQYMACRNDTLASAIEFYAMRTHLITAIKFADGAAMEHIISQHEAIIAAMKGSDNEILEACVANHFNLARVEQYTQEYELRHNISSAAQSAVKPRSTRARFIR